MDYQTIIDQPIRAFLRAREAGCPPGCANPTRAGQRARYDRTGRTFPRAYPPGVTAADRRMAGVRRRIIGGASPAILYPPQPLPAAIARARAFLEPGLVPSSLRARHPLPRAAASFPRITQAPTALATGERPYGDLR